MKRYFVGVTLPAELADQIDEVRRLFGERGERTIERNVPHITLKIPFETGRHKTEIIHEVKAVADRVGPFSCRLTTLQDFDHRVLYLGVQPVDPFRELRNRLVDRLGVVSETVTSRAEPERNRNAMQPHITLTILDSEREFGGVMKRLSAHPLPEADWTVVAIALFSWDGRRWQSITTLPLTGSSREYTDKM